MKRTAFASLLLTVCLFGQTAPGTGPLRQRFPARRAVPSVDPLFHPLLSELRAKWGRAVRVPAKMPDLGQGKDHIYAVLDRASKDGYVIYLAFTADCNGASVCRLGTLSAQLVKDAQESSFHDAKLANGLMAAYTASECGANCSDAVMRWREGLTEYSAGVKGGSREDALLLANSCLKP